MMPPFELGHPRLPGAGRAKGTPNRQTVLAREGIKSAIDICRSGGMDPISIMVESARFLRAVAAAHSSGLSSPEAIREMKRSDLDFIRRFLVDASAIAYKAAEFGYAKLQRVDHVGDAPAPQTVENKYQFVLNVNNDPGRPAGAGGRAVLDLEPGPGRAGADPPDDDG